MIVLLIILAIILTIALLRFGVVIVYGETGLNIWVRAGFLSFRIIPEKEKKVKKPKKVKDKAKLDIKPGSLNELLDMLPPFKNMLSRLKRKLLIKRLEIHYVAAGSDPSNVAMTYGVANAAINMMIPILEDNFKIKKQNITVKADFESEKQKIYVKLAISIAVWEAIYVVIALLPLLFSILFSKVPERPKPSMKIDQQNQQRKEVKENG